VILRHPDDPAIVPYSAIHCPQTLTESVLLEALEQESEASIFFDHEVMSVVESDDGLQLSVHRGRHDRTFQISAAYVIAADGAASPVRQRLGVEAIGPGDLGHFLNTYFRAPYGKHLGDRAAVLLHFLRRDLFEMFVAVNGDDLWLMHHFLRPGEKASDFPPEKLAEIVRYATGLPDVPVEILGVSPWVMSPKIAAQFRKGRIFLTGDAAARLSPAGGLGMNTGLQSAHNLAWKVAAVLRGAPESLLDSYDTERRGHVMRTFEASSALGSEIGETISAGLAGDFDQVRKLVAGSRRAGSGLGLDLGCRYEGGAFVAESSGAGAVDPNVYLPSARPGGRAPHFWVEWDGRRFSALDLFGHGFALLVAEDAAPWRAASDPTELFGGFYVEISQIGGGDGYRDVDGVFAARYEIATGGAILVRPDGIVGWRSKTCDPAGLAAALKSILAGG